MTAQIDGGDIDPGHAELLAAVDELAEAMKAKLNLRRARHSTRLEDLPDGKLVQWLASEADELHIADEEAADGTGTVEAVRDEAADLANIGMFRWIRRRRLIARERPA